MSERIRVMFCCTGIGIFNRGIETFFRDAFDGLQGIDGIESTLVKGGGDSSEREHVIWTLPRTGWLAPAIGKMAGRSAYAVEQWSSFCGVVRRIRQDRPHVIFYSDSNLAFLLYRFRRQIGVPFRLLFSNGGPCHPPFERHDFVQQVAPKYYSEALEAGEPVGKHFMIPYGIRVPTAAFLGSAEKANLKQRLGLPRDRKVVLSVGWIAKQHKRMDYVISEVAKLSAPRPFLMLLGAIDSGSKAIFDSGYRLLGSDGFAARSVGPNEVHDYYKAADVFTLASLNEGFGRVYIEALLHGLPVLAHKNEITDYVLGDTAILGDLSIDGQLANMLTAMQFGDENEIQMQRRRDWVSERFGWAGLRQQYRAMFLKCAGADASLY